MSRPPVPRRRFDASVAAMPGAVYSPLGDRLPRSGRSPVALHVGDTWMEPCVGARMQDLDVEAHPGMHRYGPTSGLPALAEALHEKLRGTNGLAPARDELLVTAGATAGLAAAVAAVASPGDEVLVLAPFWPLIRGIVQAARARPVEVPFYDRVHTADEAVAAVRAQIGPRTVALYVSTPSNPTGRVLPQDWLEALAQLGRAHDLWLISDEVYEDYVYAAAPAEHFSLARAAPERTLSAFSFSKAYGMAGNRIGYLCGPRDWVAEAHKVSMHSAYHAPVASQLAALSALRGGGADWVARARRLYEAAGCEAARTLGLPAPEGSTFLFVDVSAALDERGLPGFLEDCFEDEVLVAPGASSGAAWEQHVRLCYTAAPPAEVAAAVGRLAVRLARER